MLRFFLLVFSISLLPINSFSANRIEAVKSIHVKSSCTDVVILYVIVKPTQEGDYETKPRRFRIPPNTEGILLGNSANPVPLKHYSGAPLWVFEQDEQGYNVYTGDTANNYNSGYFPPDKRVGRDKDPSRFGAADIERETDDVIFYHKGRGSKSKFC